ncbi:MAG: hypothetical protein U9P50_00070, partial [Patescibacteria group bacterium]|nr:hypothetical protein [Patescibacteria group bacterium]
GIWSGTTQGLIGTYTNTDLRLITNGTSKVTITADGNVGVGTTNPTSTFYTSSPTVLDINSASGYSGIVLRSGGDSSVMSIGVANSGLKFSTETSNVTRMFIGQDGNIGIGTTGPNNAFGWAGPILEVNGTQPSFTLNPSGSAQEADMSSNAMGLYIQVYGHATATNNDILFLTEETNSQATPTERMRIDSSGNVGIGTTVPESVGGFSETGLVASVGSSVSSRTSHVISGDRAFLYFVDTDANANEQIMRAETNSGVFSFQSMTDVGGSQAANILTMDHSTGNVGIGTTAPGYKLEIGGALIGDALKVVSVHSGTGRSVLFQTNSGSIDAFTILGNGNVGIGITTPGEKLHLYDSNYPKIEIEGNKVGADIYGEIIFSNTDTVSYDGAKIAVKNFSSSGTGTNSGEIQFYTNDANGGLTQQMVINADGDVGIGTTGPGAKLEVEGSSLLLDGIATAGTTSLIIDTASAKHAMMHFRQASSDVWRIVLDSDDSLDFDQGGGLERMTILDGGNVGIGTTNPTDKLHVVGDAYFSADVSALSFTDRTPYPKDLQTAYDAVMSMQRLPIGQYQENNKEHQLDHSKLSSFIKAGEGRDLSATVSAQNEVIKDLVKKIEERDDKINNLIGRIENLEVKLKSLESQ